MKHINSLAELFECIDQYELCQIIIYTDDNCDMISIDINGCFVMEGNSDDFYPGCHGGWFYQLAKQYREFDSADTLAKILKEIATERGKPCEIIDMEYQYE